MARLPAAGHGVHEARWVVPRGIPEVSTSVEERSGRVGSGAGCSTQVSERPTLVMGSCSCAGEYKAQNREHVEQQLLSLVGCMGGRLRPE